MYIHYNNSHKMALTIKTIFSVLDYYHLDILHVYIKFNDCCTEILYIDM